MSTQRQAILDAIDKYGYVRVHTDWRRGRRHVTTGRGESFNARSFDALYRKGLVQPADEPHYAHQGIKWVRAGKDSE